MAELCRNYQKGAVQFTEWTAASVADAICRALTDFTLIADQAHEGAYRWRSEHGAAAFVDRLLDWMPDTSVGSAPPVSLSRAHIAVATGLTALFSAREAVIRWLKFMQRNWPPAKPIKAD